LIFETVNLFESTPSISGRYRTVYKHVCIDEAQDTSPAQYRLLLSLTGKPADRKAIKDVFAVADDDQLIYGFTGASATRLREFQADYDATALQLPVNYRCPPEIVSIANQLIAHNFHRAATKNPLVSGKSSTSHTVVRLIHEPTFESEAKAVAKDILARFSGTYNTLAVLARTRRLLLRFQELAATVGLSSAIADRKDDFTSAPIVLLDASLRLANNRNSLRHLSKLTRAWHDIFGTAVQVERVITAAKGNDRDYFTELLVDLRARDLSDFEVGVVALLSNALQKSDRISFSKGMLKLFDEVAVRSDDPLRESFADYATERAVWERLTNEIVSLRGQCDLSEFLQEMQLRSKNPERQNDVVELTTIHGVKGKQFSHVYLIGMVDEELPSFQSLQRGSQSLDVEEERRNCFVAITRAVDTLTLSYADKYRGWAKKPSRFLQEMGLV
jgi:DNA helicase-2/ATP-dependent DNA helicase PcrA